jgi:hypothetical protein
MDVIVVVAMVSFFALAAGYVRFCERIVGSQSVVSPSEAADRD